MKPGPKPKPTAELKLRGTYEAHRRRGEPEPKLLTSVPKMPPGLDNEAKRVWRKWAPSLVEMGMLADIDVEDLASHCQTWSQLKKQLARQNDEPPTLENPKTGGVIKNPFWTVLSDLHMRFMRGSDRWGLNPSARGGIKLPDSVAKGLKKKQSPASKFFKTG